MSSTITVKRYLEKQDVRYATLQYPGEQNDVFTLGCKSVSPKNVAKTIILKDLRGMIMAIIPGPNILNIETLNRQLHRSLQLADESDYVSIFSDCKPGILPALGEAYGFETIIDDGLLDLDIVYFLSGSANELVRISGYDYQLLHSNAWYGNTFSHISTQHTHETQTPPPKPIANDAVPVSKIKQQIEKITNLPPMPEMAQKIIQLNTNPYAHANDLAELVEKDPSLAAQVVRYAQSPFYGYPGKITEVRQAISRVLGFDLVMNIALGIAATRPFKNSPNGPLGMVAYWRHATYSAALTQGLCNIVPRQHRPKPGTAYLCGLLHNFGFLVLGHLFPKDIEILNEAIAKDEQTPIIEHEKTLLGTTHCEIGQWLMSAWHMPEEILVTLSEHHNLDYHGSYAEYSRLVMLADILLKSHELGDANTRELPAHILQKLELTEDQALSVLDKTIQGKDDLDSIAKLLAA